MEMEKPPPEYGHHDVHVDVNDKQHDSKKSKPPKVKEKAGCFGMYGGCFHSCKPAKNEDTNVIEYDEIEDRSCWFRIPKINIRLNPIVTVSAVVLIWSFVGWCMIDPDAANAEFLIWKVWIARSFTWLYVGSQDLWAILIVMIYFSKYAHVKLGRDDEEPEYSDATWFTMLFACGIGTGLFFFGVAEPVWHYDPAGGGNRYIADKYMPDNTLAQIAMNVTFYHWGIHGWIVYCVVGMLMGIVSYRMGLPMTVKSCLYPLLGDKIFGWMGDAIDVMSIITTLFGVCTSLGLGVMQLNTGLNIMNPIIEISVINQIIIIWCITALATCSTLSGIGLGIRRLSELCFGIGMIIMMLVFFLDNTWYILNLYVQSIGYYFQWILQLGFHCDAFEMSGPSYGGEESRQRAYPDGSADGPELWMDWWTIFYWGWWISWSPFVGMFIAKISRGRTLRQFINGTMTAPIIYTFLWLTIFGGVGIKMEREAAGAGLCCNANFDQGINATLELPELVGPWVCEGSQCNDCSLSILKIEQRTYNDTDTFLGKYKQKNFGIQLDDRSLTRLTCHTSEQMWFDVMQSYGGLGDFLSVFSLIGLVLYFVTSSDSGSFVIDCLAANGDMEPPRIQRVFWALTEGATATALLYVGGSQGLKALQTVSVAAGLPYTIFLCFFCVSLWRALQIDAGDLDPHGPQFAVGLFDVIATPTARSVFGCLLNIIIAPYSFAKATAHCGDGKRKKCEIIFFTVVLAILLIAFIILQIAVVAVPEIWAIGWVAYVFFGVAGGATRISLRAKYNINGNMIEDIFCGIICYPLTAYQVSETATYYENNLPTDYSHDSNNLPMTTVHAPDSMPHAHSPKHPGGPGHGSYQVSAQGGQPGVYHVGGRGAENPAYVYNERL